jgi:transcriptional repressor NrdR
MASAIGDMVMERLRQLDGVAYIRFASMYRDFADIEELQEEAETYAKLNALRRDTSQLPLFADLSNDPQFELEASFGRGDRGKSAS